jgi:hypothetical protein
MAATLLPNAKQTFLDGNGKPLAGGSVFFYIPNTSTFKSTWQDPAQTILNTNPVILDASGEAIIWGSGTYRQVVYDVNGNLIWDQITEDANAGLTGDLTDDVFVAGTDFTPGTTTQLTLTAGAGSITNTWIFFDGAYQADNQIASLDGLTLTFNSPIPVGVQLVTVKIGTTVAVGIPPAGSVTDSTVAPNANIDSSKLSFLQAGAGAKRRTVQSKLRESISVADFGAKGDGTTDDTAAVAAAVNSLPTGGGSVYFPPGQYLLTSFPDMTNSIGVRIYGAGGMSAGAGRPTEIMINATGSSPFINAPGSTAFVAEDIQFIVKNGGFTGFIIAYGSSPANAAFGKVRRCSLFGGTSARYTAKGVNLDKTIEAEIDSCQFGTLLFAIAGSSSGSFSNVVRIANCQFVDTSQVPIQGGGQAWRVVNNTFEGYNNGTPGQVLAGAVVNFAVNPFNGLEFSGNWLGDVLTNGGTWLSLSGGGIDIHGGNFFGGSSGSDALAFTSVDSANVEGNTFNTFGVAISFGAGNSPNIFVGPNEWQGVTNRFGSTANWPGYTGAILYEPISNSKMQVRGSASVTAGTPTTITFPFSIAGVETAPCGYTSAPGSNTPAWAIKTGTGLTLNISGSGTCSVDFHAVALLPN